MATPVPPEQSQRHLANASVALAAVGFLFSPLVVGFVPAALGVWLGSVGLRRAAAGADVNPTLCRVGIGIGFVGLLVAACITVGLAWWAVSDG